ncbi:hypothetical protein, partial [Thiolapillus sp.]|uniref:hypothetical protein n=1 Tax=Thiolapillus sp. TaxID=2017437 RepID=UPI003AF9FB94
GQTAEEARVGIHFQHPLTVVLQIIVPEKQIFGEGVEIECVARNIFTILIYLLAQLFEGHGKPRLTGAVVGEE